MTRSAKRRMARISNPMMTGRGLPNFNVCHPVPQRLSNTCSHYDFDVEVDDDLGREPTLVCTRCGADLGPEEKFDVYAKLSPKDLEIVGSWDPTRRLNPADVERFKKFKFEDRDRPAA